MKQNEDYYSEVLDDDESDTSAINLAPPKLSLTIESSDVMQICLSKVRAASTAWTAYINTTFFYFSRYSEFDWSDCSLISR